MKIIKLELGFMFGPIVKEIFSISKKSLITGVSIIDENEKINELNDKISTLFSSFYDFDAENACQFNAKTAKDNKGELMIYIDELIDELNAINDGSFVIQNMIDLNF